jgi:hypothetical protein
MNISDLFPIAVKELKNPERELLAISECVEATADLLIHNWNKARGRQGGQMEIQMKFTVLLIGNQNKVKTKLAYSERHTDERETTTRDPAQQDLFGDGDKTERTNTTGTMALTKRAAGAIIIVEGASEEDPHKPEPKQLRAPPKLLMAPPTEENKKKKRKRKKKAAY